MNRLENVDVSAIADEVRATHGARGLPVDLLHGMVRDGYFVALSSPRFRAEVAAIDAAAKWPHRPGPFRTLLCVIFHRQEWKPAGMHRRRAVCECGREWEGPA